MKVFQKAAKAFQFIATSNLFVVRTRAGIEHPRRPVLVQRDVKSTQPDGEWIIPPYITFNRKRICPKATKYFRFSVPRDKVRTK